MLKKIETYVREKIPFAKRFLKNSQNGFSKGVAILSISPTVIDILVTGVAAENAKPDFCKSYPYERPENLKSVLAALVRENHLKMKPCIWILQPDDFQLILTDALPVTDSEFAAAIRWKIKDLITLPIDDIVVDHFPVPAASTEATKKIMVVVARNSYLQAISEKIMASDLHLEIIDIPELCFRNINALYENAEDIVAMIYVQEKIMQLLITHHGKLYFSRRLNSKLTADKTIEVDKLSVEMQRSFDYFANQWRLKIPTKVLFVASVPISADEVAALAQKINVPVELIDVLQKIDSTLTLSLSEQGRYLSLLGYLVKIKPKKVESSLSVPKQFTKETAP